MKNIPYRYYLPEEKLPKAWYNLRSAMKEKPEPLVNPGTGKPVTFQDLQPVFCDELIHQGLDDDTPELPIPQPTLDTYRIYRPSPMIRAYRLEQELKTPARIYYKFEGNNTSGSHKLNSALAQAYYAKAQGMTSLTTETGAGQWGTALAEACAAFGLDLTVYMVKGSYNQKPYRKDVMRTFGAKVIASPSDTTHAGRAILSKDPNTTGSLGCAISEAVEKAVTTPGCRYVLGSVLNQVLLHQSVIGLESYEALKEFSEYPDVVIGCAGGGSNLGGLIGHAVRGGGARLLPVLDPGPVRIRLLRHRQDHADGQDVHAGRGVHPLAQPRGRPPLPRHVADALEALPRRLSGGGVLRADAGVRRGGKIRAAGDHTARA